MPSYNQIGKEAKNIILWKNADSEPISMMPFKDMQIEWGLLPGGNIRVRRFIYPDSDYNIIDVMKIARKTEECPFCVKGHYISDITKTGDREILNTQGVDNKNMFKFAGMQGLAPVAIPKSLDEAASQSVKTLTGLGVDNKLATMMVDNLSPQLLAKLPQFLLNYGGSNLGRLIGNGIIGIGGMVGLWQGWFGPLSSRSENGLANFFANFIAELGDTRKGQSFDIQGDIETIKNAISFGDAGQLMNALVDPEWQSKLQADFSLPNLDFGNLGSFNLPQLPMLSGLASFGNNLAPSKTTPTPNVSKMLPPAPAAKTFTVPFKFNTI